MVTLRPPSHVLQEDLFGCGAVGLGGTEEADGEEGLLLAGHVALWPRCGARRAERERENPSERADDQTPVPKYLVLGSAMFIKWGEHMGPLMLALDKHVHRLFWTKSTV